MLKNWDSYISSHGQVTPRDVSHFIAINGYICTRYE